MRTVASARQAMLTAARRIRHKTHAHAKPQSGVASPHTAPTRHVPARENEHAPRAAAHQRSADLERQPDNRRAQRTTAAAISSTTTTSYTRTTTSTTDCGLEAAARCRRGPRCTSGVLLVLRMHGALHAVNLRHDIKRGQHLAGASGLGQPLCALHRTAHIAEAVGGGRDAPVQVPTVDADAEPASWNTLPAIRRILGMANGTGVHRAPVLPWSIGCIKLHVRFRVSNGTQGTADHERC